MSALQIPKQRIPLNNNNNKATTTKGIAKALTNSTSPQSDSENRPINQGDDIKNAFVNGAPKSGTVNSVSPGANFKQSTISFNYVKPEPVLTMSELVSRKNEDSSSDSDSPYSSEDDVLLVTQPTKKEEPLKTAKVSNQASAKGADATPKQKNPSAKNRVSASPVSNSSNASLKKTNGFTVDEKLSPKTKEQGGKKSKKSKTDSSLLTNGKASKDEKEKVLKKSSKNSLAGKQTSPKPKSFQFVPSSDEDEPLCKLGKTKANEDKPLEPPSVTSNEKQKAKKSKAKSNPVSAVVEGTSAKPAAIESDSEDNEDVPLSVIKLKSPLKTKHLKTKPFSPGKINKQKAGQNIMQKHFSTISEKGKLKVEYQQPPIVIKLVKSMEVEGWKEDPEKIKRVRTMISLAAKNLTAFQRERIPAVAKQMVLDKRKELDERERWKSLTQEQKDAEIKAKRLERQRQLQLQKAELPEKPKLVKQDDLLHENVRPLPKPTPIVLPDGVSMKMYGDAVMVIEFLHIFRGLLSPDDSYELDFRVSFLLEALTVGNDGFLFLSSIMETLLKSLLQDQLNEMLADLETNLSKVTVTCHSVSDLCRLYLSHVLQDEERSQAFDPEPELISAMEKLKTADFTDLLPAEKLSIISFFCHEVLKTAVYEHYLHEKQAYFTECWKWKHKALQDYNKYMKEKSDREADLNAKKAEIIAKASEHVYGEASAETTSSVIDTSSEMDADKFLTIAEEHAILTSSMSRRQQEMELAKLRKDREERFRKIKVEQEIEEGKIALEKDKSENEFEKVSSLVHKLLRLSPIGYDRYHNRYWVLESVPGILVERLWADENISFETTPCDLDAGEVSTNQDQNSHSKQESPEGSIDEPGKDESEIQVLSSTSTNVKGPTKQEIPSRLLPRVGQNSWVVYDTPEQLDSLIKRLYEWGNRECGLKGEVKKHIAALTKKLEAIKGREKQRAEAKSNNEAPQSSGENQNVKIEIGEDVEELERGAADGDEEEEDEEALPVLPKKFKDHYLSYLQSDMKELHLRLFNGGLSWGDPEAIENKIDRSKSMEEMKQCLVRLYECVIPKFLTGVLKADATQLYAADKQSQWNIIDSPERPSISSQEPDSNPTSEFESWCDQLLMKRLPEGTKKWLSEVINATTWSRLHVLLAIVDTCVRWEKSVAKSGCTVCRKKANEDKTLLCDECNRAYHMYCLRPALKEVPPGDWLCPGCRPREGRSAAQVAPNYAELSDEEASKKQEDSEEFCFCCLDGGDELIMCNSCPRVYHLNCHQPPMRRVPRGNWNCMVCLNPRLKRKKGFLQTESQDEDRGTSYHSDDSSESSRSTGRVKKRARLDESESDEDDANVRRSSRSTKGNRVNLYRSTLDKARKGGKSADSDDGSVSDEDGSSRMSSRGKGQDSGSSDNESEARKGRGLSGEGRYRKRIGSTSAEVSPERDSTDNRRNRGSKRGREENSDSDRESQITKKTKKAQENGAARDNYEVLEVAEEVDICEKIFLDLKSRSNFMFFENIAEVEAYSKVQNKVDFSTIQVMMQEPEYIWKGFIRDLAFIVNNAMSAFDENHKVHKAAIKLEERIRVLLSNLPIMKERYQKIRDGESEKEIEREEELQKEVIIETVPEVILGKDEAADFNDEEAEEDNHDDDDEPSKYGGSSQRNQDDDQSQPREEHDSTCRSQYQPEASSLSRQFHDESTMSSIRSEDSSTRPQSSKFRENPAQFYMQFKERQQKLCSKVKVVEVDAEAEICGKILYRFKHLHSLSYFVNVSDVAAYSRIKRKADFMKMEQKMKKKGYIWENFVADLALIVNNALVAFQPQEAAYKAGIRLDKKAVKALENFPRMLSHYRFMRGQADEFVNGDEDDEVSLATLMQTSSTTVLSEERKHKDGMGSEKEKYSTDDNVNSTSKSEHHNETSEGEVRNNVSDAMAEPSNVNEKNETSQTEEVKELEKDEKQIVVHREEQSSEVCAELEAIKDSVDISAKSPHTEFESGPKTTPERPSKVECSTPKSISDKKLDSSVKASPIISKLEEGSKTPGSSKTVQSVKTPKSSASSVGKQSSAIAVKSSPIQFFVGDESSECMSLCCKMFQEIADKPQFDCFHRKNMPIELKQADGCSSFDQIASKLENENYPWVNLLRDLASIVNYSISLFKSEHFIHRTAVKLDVKVNNSLRGVSSMKKMFEKLREEFLLPPNFVLGKSHLIPDRACSEHLGLQGSDFQSSEMIDSSADVCSSQGSMKVSDGLKESALEFDDSETPIENKTVTTRTLEKSELQQLCINLFSELKADESLIPLKYLTKDSVCQNFAKKTDFAKIEKKLSRPGYIWGKFVKDLAAVTYIALKLYPKESSVYKAGLTLDFKMESSLRKFPVMLKKFVRTRDEPALESVDSENRNETTKFNSNTVDALAGDHSSGSSSSRNIFDKIQTPEFQSTMIHSSSPITTSGFTKSESTNLCKSKSPISNATSPSTKTRQKLPSKPCTEPQFSPGASQISHQTRTAGQKSQLADQSGFNAFDPSAIMQSLREDFACFESLPQFSEQVPDLKYMETSLKSESYTCSLFVQDLAILVNSAMSRFKDSESKLYQAAMRLDVRLLSLLCCQNDLRDEYKKHRSNKQLWSKPNKPSLETSRDHLETPKRLKLDPDDQKTHLSYDVKDGKSDSEVDEERELTQCAKTPSPSRKTMNESKTPLTAGSKTAGTSTNSCPFVRKVEIDEETDICNKIFLDIKTKVAFQVFQNVSKVPSYSAVQRTVDFMSIESRMEESGYIWAKFIRDVATIVNNATDVFEDSHTVHKSALKLDKRMLVLMQRLPIMRAHYDKVRSKSKVEKSPQQSDHEDRSLEETKPKTSEPSEKEVSTTSLPKRPKLELDCLESSSPKIMEGFQKEMSLKLNRLNEDIVASVTSSPAKSINLESTEITQNDDRSIAGSADADKLLEKPESAVDIAKDTLEKVADLERGTSPKHSQVEPNDAESEMEENMKLETKCGPILDRSFASSSHMSSSSSPSKNSSRSGAAKTLVVRQEVDEEVDICEKIFLDIRSKSSFICFENIDCVPAYSKVSRKVDFAAVERQMHDSGYIWEKFITDMALIVNNAQAVFEPDHKAFKASVRMDQRMTHLMRNLPIMMARYTQVRGGAGANP